MINSPTKRKINKLSILYFPMYVRNHMGNFLVGLSNLINYFSVNVSNLTAQSLEDGKLVSFVILSC